MTTQDEITQVAELLKAQADMLIQSGTGGLSIRDSDSDQIYQANDRRLLRISKEIGLPEPFPWRTLWEWHKFYSENTSGYTARRSLVGTLLRKAQDALEDVEASRNDVVPSLVASKRIVQAALTDSEALISQGNYATVVDRIHTSVHGHLKWICANHGIAVQETDPSITRLMKLLRENHPNFARTATLDEELQRMLMGIGGMLDSLNTVRNKASLAHPIDELLQEPEARLAVNVALSILNYVDDKTQSTPINPKDD